MARHVFAEFVDFYEIPEDVWQQVKLEKNEIERTCGDR